MLLFFSVDFLTELVPVNHQTLGDDDGRQPGLHRARHQRPVRQVDPPFGVVMFEHWLGAPNVQHGADEHRQKHDRHYQPVQQVAYTDLGAALPLER